MSQQQAVGQETEEISKRDKIINALLAGGINTENARIADIVGCTNGYVSQVKSDIESGEMTKEQASEARNPNLLDEYTEQFEQPTRDEIPPELQDAQPLTASTSTQSDSEYSDALSDFSPRDDIEFAESVDPELQLIAIRNYVAFQMEQVDQSHPTMPSLLQNMYVIDLALSTLSSS